MRKIVLSILLVCLMSSAHAATWGDWLGYLNPGKWCQRRTKPQKMVVAEVPVSPASSTSFETLSPIYPHKKSLESKAHVASVPVQDWDERDGETLVVHTVLEMVERSKVGGDNGGYPKNAWGEAHLQHQARLVTRYINGLFDEGWTKPQIMQAILTTLSTGGLGYEIRGELRRWLDQTTFTACLTEAGYEYFSFNTQGINLLDNLKLGMTINLSLALAPYIPQRLAAFWGEFTSGLLRPCYRLLKDDNPTHHAKLRAFLKANDRHFQEHRLETTYPLWAEITGNFVVLASAGVMGFIPAYALYKSNIGFDDTAYLARTLPPFLGAFYGMDAFARFHVLKDKLLAKLCVGCGDTVYQKRQGLIAQIEDLEKRIPTMDEYDLKQLYQELQGSHAVKRVFNGRTKIGQTSKTSQTRWQKIKQAAPWVLGGTTALALAYLYYVQVEQSLADGYQYFDTGKPSLSDTIRFNRVVYGVFEKYTDNVTIFDGNGTDWITQCFQSAIFTEGSPQDGGVFSLSHCPGVKPRDLWNSGPGDFDYIEANAYGLYDFIDGNYAGLAGINNTNNGGIGVLKNSYVLPIGGKVFANGLAAVTSTATFGIATYFGKKLVDRIIEINGCTNKFVLFVALLESLVRAAPVGFSGWVNLPQALDPGFLYTTLAVGTMAMLTTYVGDFDDVYKKTPHCIHEIGNVLKNGVNWLTGLCGHRLFKKSTLTHSALQTKILLSLGEMKESMTVAKKDVVESIWKVTQASQKGIA